MSAPAEPALPFPDPRSANALGLVAVGGDLSVERLLAAYRNAHVFVYPTLLAMIVLAIPPVLVNAFAGIRAVDAEVVGAARGMGLTERQVLLRVEVPLALPVVLGGVWRLVTWTRILPAWLRDPFYRLVARMRYRLFG